MLGKTWTSRGSIDHLRSAWLAPTLFVPVHRANTLTRRTGENNTNQTVRQSLNANVRLAMTEANNSLPIMTTHPK
jgi:hypothetical protein